MMRAENSSLPELWVLPRSCSKNTPGERCNWETMTRSVPLMTNEPVVVMSGISPMYTSCSFTSLIVSLGASLSMITRRTRARSGEAKVSPRCWHSLTSNAGSPSRKCTNSRRALPECEEIGKIEVNAACRPWFLRCAGATSACRKAV